MLTLDEFIAKYNSKGIDFDGAYGNQCMDLYRQYVKECIGGQQSAPVPSAKDVWETYNKDTFERIPNTPTGVPSRGDVIIWGTTLGVHGHIAVFVEGNQNSFNSFDQNYPLKSPCHIQPHTYKGVLGWLKPKTPTTTNPPNDEAKQAIETVKKLQAYNGVWYGAQDIIRDYESVKKELSDRGIELDTTRKQLADMEKDCQSLSKSLTACQNKPVNTTEPVFNDRKSALKYYINKIIDLFT